VLLGRERWIMELLKAIETGKLAAKDLDLSRRNRLLNHRSTEIRALATKTLGDVIDPSRQKVVDAYQSALTLTGDAAHGKMVFTQNCATCHKLNGVGVDIGPNLLSVGSWAPDAVMVAILDPSRAVEPRYLSFNVTLTDGDAIYGIIAAESPASITIKGLDGKERIVPRLAIKTLTGTNRSLMPDGLESALSKQDLADVIRFVLSAQGGN
ncbi:MAG TPA: c-type cytochrome, partial [Humisphaera sp.]|nr:c-type cytochrome [Humisphaera sp.]